MNKATSLLLVVVLASCGLGVESGSVAVSLMWEEQPPGKVFLWLRVEERSAPELAGTILASAGPIAHSPGEPLSIPLPVVPNGRKRYVVVEVREDSNAGLPILYYGLSKPFEVTAGKSTQVDTYLAIQAPESEQENTSVTLVFHGAPAIAVGPEEIISATVATRFSGGVSLVLANDAAFSANLTTLSLQGQSDGVECSPDEEFGGDWQLCNLHGWDLSAEVPDLGDGVYSVYAKFVDHFGYESRVRKASVVLDSTGPEMLVASVSPPTAKAGDVILLTVTFQEALAKSDGADLAVLPPTSAAPTFVGPERISGSTSYLWRAEVLAGSQDDATVYTFTVQGRDKLGNIGEMAALVDDAGNKLELRVDKLSPVLQDPAEILPETKLLGLGDLGSLLTLDYQIVERNPLVPNDDCSNCPQVRMGGQAVGTVAHMAEDDEAESDLLAFRYEYTLDMADWGAIDKEQEIMISWADAAGNTMETELPSGIRMDLVRPSEASCSLQPKVGTGSSEFVYAVTASEPLAKPPELDVQSDNPELFLGSPEVLDGDVSFIWRQAAAELESETFTVSALLTDPAGNESEAPVCVLSASLDVHKPTLIDAAVSVIPDVKNNTGEQVLAVGDGGTISAAFNVHEDVGLAPDYPKVDLAVPGHMTAFVQSEQLEVEPGIWMFVYTLTLDTVQDAALEGLWPVRVTLSDGAGNLEVVESLALELVQVDFSAPQAQCGLVPMQPGVPYAIGDKITLQVFSLEQLEAGSAPTLIVEQGGIPAEETFFSPVVDSTYLFTAEVVENAGETEFTVTVNMRDLAGNETAGGETACLSGLLVGAIDGNIPVITGAQVKAFRDGVETGPDQKLKSGDKVTVQVDVAGTSLAPEVYLGAGQMETTAEAEILGNGDLRWLFERVLSGLEGEGIQPVMLAGFDEAGNFYDFEIQDDTTFLDFSGPSVLSSTLTLLPPPEAQRPVVEMITNGTVITLHLLASEVLLTSPLVAAKRGDSIVQFTEQGFAPASGTWIFQAEASGLGPAEDVQGAWELEADLVDLAGNEEHVTLSPTPAFVVDTISPKSLTAESAGSVRHYRNTWGSKATDYAPLYEVRGCGDPALGAAGWDWCPKSGPAFAEPGAWVTVFRGGADDAGNTCTNKALAQVDADSVTGQFAAPLFVDWRGLCIVQSDLAGNLSTVSPVTRVEWVGTFGGFDPDDPLSNPHVLRRITAPFENTLPRAGAPSEVVTAEADLAAVASHGGDTVTREGAPYWKMFPPFEQETAWSDQAKGYIFDAGRGRVVHFGLSQCNGCGEISYQIDVRESDGEVLETKSFPCGEGIPESRTGALYAYDPVRGTTVMYGGVGHVSKVNLDETWEYDGEGWLQRQPQHVPGPAVYGTMVWDPTSARVILLARLTADNGGGLFYSMWAWGGEDWEEVLPATTWLGQGFEEIKYAPIVVPLPAEGQLLALVQPENNASSTQTVIWDGHDWVFKQKKFVGFPGRPLVYDHDTGKLSRIICGTLNNKWVDRLVWTGESWVTGEMDCTDFNDFNVVTTDPVTGVPYGVSTDSPPCKEGTYRPLARYTDGAWKAFEDCEGPPGLSANSQSSAAYAEGIGKVVLSIDAGTKHNRTFLWDDDWTAGPNLFAGDRSNHVIGYDILTESIVTAGGDDLPYYSLIKDTWVWTAETGAKKSNTETYPAKPLAMVYMDHLERLVAIAQIGNGLTLYEWTGNDWQVLWNGPVPFEITSIRVTWDLANERLALLTSAERLWFWKEGEEWWSPDEGVENPPALMSASFLSYDTARSAVVVVGLRHSDDQWKLAHIEFANGAWGEMELHEGTAPAAYHHGQALLFARDRGTLMYVKQDGLRAWSGAQARPHLGVSFDLSGPAQVLPSVSDPIPRELLSVGLSVSAGGRAHALGTGTGNGEVFDGYQVYLMGQSAAGATLLHENQNAGPEVPEDWSGTFAADWVESQGIYLTPALSDWLDRHGRLQLLVTTRAAQGSSSAPARIELDYVEVDVVYNRGPAGEPGTPCLDEAGYFEDGRWCDDGDPATAFSMCRGGQCLGFGAP